MAMIGNLPSANSDGLILTPWIEPENVNPPRPWMPVTLADSVSTKSPGLFSGSSHWTPSASIRIGRNEGHLNESPVAEPTDKKTPKPDSALKPPLPVNAKLRPSPAITREPIDTWAPTEPKLTIRLSVPAAPVSSLKSRADRVT